MQRLKLLYDLTYLTQTTETKHKLKTAHFSEELVLARDFKEFKGFQKKLFNKY